MSVKVTTAMILAAGLGTRMRPLTLSIPKPLVKICDKPMLLRTIEHLQKAGIKKIIINVHYLGQKIIDYLENLNLNDVNIIISDEREKLLDSAGGIINALPHLGADPFFVLNADSFWVDNGQDNLHLLADFFDADKMNMALFVLPRQKILGNERGDFFIDDMGRLSRAPAYSEHAYNYLGALIVNPHIFERNNHEPHSLNYYFDKAIEKGCLYGLPLLADWYTIGTMDMIDVVEHKMKERQQV